MRKIDRQMETKHSITGFIASTPKLSTTERGDPRLFFKIGIEHYTIEDDNSFTKEETTFHNVVAFNATARHGKQKLARGDHIIAHGRTHTYTVERDGQLEEEEEFIAARLGHDLARTRYTPDRSQRRTGIEHEAPHHETSSLDSSEGAGHDPAHAPMGM